MKTMCHILPQGHCPNCGHVQFVVSEALLCEYLTGRYGEIVDYKEEYHNTIGKCVKCGAEYPMLSTSTGFIPLTPMREAFLIHGGINEELIGVDDCKKVDIPNPMEA